MKTRCALLSSHTAKGNSPGALGPKGLTMNINADTLNQIVSLTSQAEYMSKYGQECADQYLNKAAEFGVDYWTAYDLMHASAHCESREEFTAVVVKALAA